MGEGGGGEEKGRFSPSPLSLFRFHLSPFPQKHLILGLNYYQSNVIALCCNFDSETYLLQYCMCLYGKFNEMYSL